MAAVKVAIQKQLMKKNACTVGALDCWSGFGPIVGFPPCLSAENWRIWVTLWLVNVT